MRNELFTIGPLTVYGYGFMIAVGVIAAWIITNRRAEKQKLDHEHVFSLVIWCLLGGMFCAKILFWITEWKICYLSHGHSNSLPTDIQSFQIPVQVPQMASPDQNISRNLSF